MLQYATLNAYDQIAKRDLAAKQVSYADRYDRVYRIANLNGRSF